ncbi:uncharacterized protein LOC131146151 [Malania oleifera]|uniref:uncharacterized protein LOC131146151 n=1 Tax=Malania oleifera TaxID=397392 RepID=UPI0025AE1BEA|nr:uncharacterized protein LOC131146151 [Malania oleifera]XP_057951502.1 uncharacterized protein LOC131146151 [Malania oleifera]XP_057951503.1 uncharacterized protein LOC131146151 [Malania oleifera]
MLLLIEGLKRVAESKLLEIKERKERRGCSTKAAALSTPIEVGEEDVLDDDGEEEREVTDSQIFPSKVEGACCLVPVVGFPSLWGPCLESCTIIYCCWLPKKENSCSIFVDLGFKVPRAVQLLTTVGLPVFFSRSCGCKLLPSLLDSDCVLLTTY